jgi:hypothetical protein
LQILFFEFLQHFATLAAMRGGWYCGVCVVFLGMKMIMWDDNDAKKRTHAQSWTRECVMCQRKASASANMRLPWYSSRSLIFLTTKSRWACMCSSSCRRGVLSWTCLKTVSGSRLTSRRKRINTFRELLSWRCRRTEGWGLSYNL